MSLTEHEILIDELVSRLKAADAYIKELSEALKKACDELEAWQEDYPGDADADDRKALAGFRAALREKTELEAECDYWKQAAEERYKMWLLDQSLAEAAKAYVAQPLSVFHELKVDTSDSDADYPPGRPHVDDCKGCALVSALSALDAVQDVVGEE